MNRNEVNALTVQITTRRGAEARFGTDVQKAAYSAGREDAEQEIIEIIQRNADNVPLDNSEYAAASVNALLSTLMLMALRPPFSHMSGPKDTQKSDPANNVFQHCDSLSAQELCGKSAGVSLSPPWIIYRKKLAKLFELDNDVIVSDVENKPGGKTIHIRTAQHEKADALYALLDRSMSFGNVGLNVVVHDDSEDDAPTGFGELDAQIKAAFAGNRIVRRVQTVTDSRGFQHTYLVMEPMILQLWADNLADIHGNLTMTAEELARDVLNIPGVSICTADVRENRLNDGGAEN